MSLLKRIMKKIYHYVGLLVAVFLVIGGYMTAYYYFMQWTRVLADKLVVITGKDWIVIPVQTLSLMLFIGIIFIIVNESLKETVKK